MKNEPENQISPDEYWKIIEKLFPTINECWLIQKSLGVAPQLFHQGMIYGYLLAKGFPKEEASIGLIQYNKTIDRLTKQYPDANPTLPSGTNLLFHNGEFKKV